MSVWIWAAINPYNRFDWLLENILTFLCAVVLLTTFHRFPMSDISYVQIFAFLTLHAIGGHYTYSQVPLGFWFGDSLDLHRNHYDRLVHFSFGALLAYPLREVILRLVTRKAFFALLFAWSLLLAFSGSYEIIEWLVAIVVDPKAGAAYLGTQGDEFDAQKDMALAASGALVTLGLTGLFYAKSKDA